MADELPASRPVGAGVEIDSRAIVAPAVARAQDRASGKATQRLRQFRQSRLRAEAPAIDLVRQVRDVFPVRTAVFALEDGEVVRAVAGERGCGDDGAILQLGVAWVSDAFGTGRSVDRVVGEEAPWSWLVVVRVWESNRHLREERGRDKGDKHCCLLAASKLVRCALIETGQDDALPG